MENDLTTKTITDQMINTTSALPTNNFDKLSIDRRHSIDKSTHHLLYKSISSFESSSPPAVKPIGKIFNLIPRLVRSNNSSPLNGTSSRNKEPRFIPFEPYKAAINPIIPYKKPQNKIKLNNKNNLDLSVLVTQMSQVTSTELNNIVAVLDEVSDKEKHQQDHDKQLLEMKKERDYYANQLKFQVSVNSELKNLLVASIGEDLQTRVNVLTEDKLQLARALLNTAENLSSHTVMRFFLLFFCHSSLFVFSCFPRNKWNTSLDKAKYGAANSWPAH
jgi:hypothetical protein